MEGTKDSKMDMYDVEQGITLNAIVGWNIWYSDGSRYSSLNGYKGDDLPDHDVQVLIVYYMRPDGKRNPDGSAGLYRAVYTRDRYKVPFSTREKFGDWTSMVNHDDITKKAISGWWPE